MQREILAGYRELGGCIDRCGNLVIPSIYRSIGPGAFRTEPYGYMRPAPLVTSITMPDSVTEIGDEAFSQCTALVSCNMPLALETLGKEAFFGCSKLKEVVFADAVRIFGRNAFSGCTSLERAVLPAHVKVLPESTFRRCTSLRDVVLPLDLETISRSAFESCKSLERIVLPPGVTSIKERAFCDCTSLREIFLPETVQKIEDSAFSGCTSLERISLPSSMELLGSQVFRGCKNLSQCILPVRISAMGFSVFNGCRSLTDVTVPEGAVHLIGSFFSGCSKLKEVHLPSTLENAETGAFLGCTSMRDFDVSPGNACYTGRGPFLCSKDGTNLILAPGCTDDDTVPSSVVCISANAFNGCKMHRLVLPDTVHTLTAGALAGMANLEFLRGPCVSVCSPDTVLGTNRGTISGRIFPMVLPKISISKARQLTIKQAMAMGYLLEPALYDKRSAASYEKFVSGNLALLSETARRGQLEDVSGLLRQRSQDAGSVAESSTDSSGVSLFIDSMTVDTARRLFISCRSDTGIQITAAKQKYRRKLVVIPRVIGRTPVTSVQADALDSGAVVRCSGQLFKALPVNYQFNTFIAYLNGSVEFSWEQRWAMEDYFGAPQRAERLCNYAMDHNHPDVFAYILKNRKHKLELYDTLLEKTSTRNLADFSAIILDAKNSYYTQEQILESRERVMEEEAGLRDLSLSTLRKTFKCRKSEGKILISGFQHTQTSCFIPEYADGLPVAIKKWAFHSCQPLESVVFESGDTEIGDYALACCNNLEITAPPGSTVEKYCREHRIKFLPSAPLS